MLANTADALPQAQVLGVDGDTMIFVLASSTNVGPAAFLLLEIKASGVWHEHNTQEHACQAKPWHDIKLCLGVDVVVEDSSRQSTEFAARGGETVGCGTDSNRIHLSSDKEGDTVRSKLIEEGRQEIHGLE